MAKEKTKIIYIITKGNWGGAQKYVFDLASALPKESFDVSVVLGEGEILEKKLLENNIEVIKIAKMKRDISFFDEFSVFFSLLKILRDESPEIVHLNSSKAGGLGSFAARLAGVPKIIFTVHGWYFNEPIGLIKRLLTILLSWFTIIFSSDIIVMSMDNLRQAVRFPMARKKTSLIYNGLSKIDFKDRKSTREFISSITKADTKKLWLVTISELHKNKGLEYVLDALPYLKNKLIFFVIGKGEERENLEKKVKNLNLKKNVYLMGFLENAAHYLKAFDLFSLTSVKEGNPYTILEAGLAGLPVLASNIPGIKDIIDEETGILVPPRNPDVLRKALDKIVNNKKNMAQLGGNLKKKIIRNFSFEKSFKETLRIYKE